MRDINELGSLDTFLDEEGIKEEVTTRAKARVEAVTGAKMTDYDLDVLRVLNGEDVPGMVAGAAMWTAAAWLVGRGYAQGSYQITQKGRDYLAALRG